MTKTKKTEATPKPTTLYRKGMLLHELVDAARDVAREFGKPRASYTTVARACRMSRVCLYNACVGKSRPMEHTLENLSSGLTIFSGIPVTLEQVRDACDATHAGTHLADDLA